MIDCLQAISSELARHAQAYGLGSGVLLLAVVARWPETIPHSAQEWWTWARDSFQTAMPIPHNLVPRRPTAQASSDPTQPVGPAQQK